MSLMPSRIARLLAVGGAVAALGTAPIALADPSDLEPVCSAEQSPAEDQCRTGCPGDAPLDPQGFCDQPGTVDITTGPADEPFASSPGADPQLPVGPAGS